MPAHSSSDDLLAGRPRSLDDVIATSQLIDQLPRTMTTLPSFALAASSAGQPWQVSVTLSSADQAALDALHPSATQLCAAAQHALGLAAVGSVIEPTRGTVVVRVANEIELRLVGESALWWVANAPPSLLQAFLQGLIAEVEQHRQE